MQLAEAVDRGGHDFLPGHLAGNVQRDEDALAA
jgi:hypothetical protein